MNCNECGNKLRRSRRRSEFERLLGYLRLFPFYCSTCNDRSYHFSFSKVVRKHSKGKQVTFLTEEEAFNSPGKITSGFKMLSPEDKIPGQFSPRKSNKKNPT